MSKVVLFAASLLLVAGIASAGIIDPCLSEAIYNGDVPGCYYACPAGDTQSMELQGFTIDYTIVDGGGVPIEGIPGTDFWLVSCDLDPTHTLFLCAGSASSDADFNTNADGETEMAAGSIAAGGCVDYLSPVCQGFALTFGTPPNCDPYCFNIWLRSPDLNADGLINIQDLGKFGLGYPPNGYISCVDQDCNGIINIQDLSKFAFHFGPPGHLCE